MNSFEGLGIQEKIIKAITELGFSTPTPIQEQAIPLLIKENTDVVALAQTGTGKTAAFGIPIIQKVNVSSQVAGALILCPTRELCLQITRDLKDISKYISGVNVVAIYGGASIDNQIREIKRGAHIIVGTPGRMVDMIDRKAINLKSVSCVVLDEADEMLSMGFQEDLTKILSQTPSEKNTMLFSATMSKEIASIARKYMSNPHEIVIGGRNQGAENIQHIYYIVNERDKYPALKRIADFNPDIFAIVFCRTKIETQKIADLLIKDGYNADALHGDLSQAQRDFVMKRYRSRSLQMLVATDVAARGIDVDDVTHVINYNIPDELESYTHRSGRTARAGKSGISVVLVNHREINKIKILERIAGKKFHRSNIPTGTEVCGKQLLHLVKKVHSVEVNEQGIMPYMQDVLDELKDLSREELIKRFVSMEFNRFLEYYKNAPDLNISESQGLREGSLKKLFINLGKLDGFDQQSLQTYMQELTGAQISFYRADLKNAYSFVEVNTTIATAILGISGQHQFNGRTIKIERSDKKEGEGRSSGSYRSGSGSREYGKPFPKKREGPGGWATKKREGSEGWGKKKEGGTEGGGGESRTGKRPRFKRYS